jgi:hypothetical protein
MLLFDLSPRSVAMTSEKAVRDPKPKRDVYVSLRGGHLRFVRAAGSRPAAPSLRDRLSVELRETRALGPDRR